MNNFDTRISTVYMRVDDLRREAEEYKMAKLAQAGRVSFSDRLFARIGDALIAYGATLKQRAERHMDLVGAQSLSNAQRMEL